MTAAGKTAAIIATVHDGIAAVIIAAIMETAAGTAGRAIIATAGPNGVTTIACAVADSASRGGGQAPSPTRARAPGHHQFFLLADAQIGATK